MTNPDRVAALTEGYKGVGLTLEAIGNNLLRTSGSFSNQYETGNHQDSLVRFVELVSDTMLVTTFYEDDHITNPGRAATWRQVLPSKDETYSGQLARVVIEQGWKWQKDIYGDAVKEREQVFAMAGVGGCFPLIALSFAASGKFESMNINTTSYTDLIRRSVSGFEDGVVFTEAGFTGFPERSRSQGVEKLAGPGIHIVPTHRSFRITTPEPLNSSLNKTTPEQGLQASFGNYWFKLFYDAERLDFQIGRISQGQRLVLATKVPTHVDFDLIRDQAVNRTRMVDPMPGAIPISFYIPALGVDVQNGLQTQ